MPSRMPKDTTYTQVRLQRGNTQLITWIPTPFAARNRYLKLKREDGEWQDGWRIVSVGAEQSSEYIAEHECNYLSQREASDV